MDKKTQIYLEELSFDNNISFETLTKVYSRGYNRLPPPNLTREQNAMHRVHSYLNGGKAKFIDEDLDRKDSHLRDSGTTTLVDIYKNDTPGQNKTLSVIKKLAREKNA